MPRSRKRDGRLATDQFREQSRRELPLETQGRDISVQNDPAHPLGQIGPPGRVGKGKELFQFLIGLKDAITSQILGRLDGLGTLRAEELIQTGLPLGQWRDVSHVVMARGAS
jgi:hypothetical protein